MSVFECVYVVALGEEVECVSDEDDGFTARSKCAEDGIGEKRFPDVSVN